MSPAEQLAAVLREEARRAEAESDAEGARRLLDLAGTTDEMTPAERTWAAEASEEQMRGFARSLREGCAAAH